MTLITRDPTLGDSWRPAVCYREYRKLGANLLDSGSGWCGCQWLWSQRSQVSSSTFPYWSSNLIIDAIKDQKMAVSFIWSMQSFLGMKSGQRRNPKCRAGTLLRMIWARTLQTIGQRFKTLDEKISTILTGNWWLNDWWSSIWREKWVHCSS